jgi:DNA mismatch repair protein MutS
LPEHLADEIARLAPVETLVPENAADGLHPPMSGTVARPDWTFDPTTTAQTLHRHFGIATLAGFGFDDAQPCLLAAGAVLHYLQETLKASLSHVLRLTPYSPANHLVLDEVTRRSLELTRTLRDNARDGSVLATLDRTVTPMGARRLHDELLAPLRDRSAIEARFDAVDELTKNLSLRETVRSLLDQTADLQRLTARVSTARATPKDLAAVARTLQLLPKL